MWDYNKLFAEGNIVGIKKSDGKIYNIDAGIKQRNIGVLSKCHNDSLSFGSNDGENFIQYIIRLDEHGNIVEKLFDRDRDMEPEPKPVPELETGMFVRVPESGLGYVNVENNCVIYQSGGFDYIDGYDGIRSDIVEAYNAPSFNHCIPATSVWRK